MDLGCCQGKPLLKPYQHPVGITLYLRQMGIAGMLDDVSQDIGNKLAVGDLAVLVGISITLHALHQKVAEHAVFGFLQGLCGMVAGCCGAYR